MKILLLLFLPVLTFAQIADKKASLTFFILDTPRCAGMGNEIITPEHNIDCQKKLHSWYLIDLIRKTKATVYIFSVFDFHGKPDALAWQRAIDESLKIKPDLIITASALPFTGTNPITKLPNAPIFAAAVTQKMNMDTSLKYWPQQEQLKNLVTIGNLIPSVQNKNSFFEDTQILKNQNIDYYFSEETQSEFKGSSYAVAAATVRAVEICRKKLKELKKCLAEKKYLLKEPNFFTY